MSGCALDCQWWGACTRAFILLLWLNHAGHDSRGMGKLSHVKMLPHSITSTKASPSLCLVNYIKCFTLSCENCSFQHISTSFCWPTLVKKSSFFLSTKFCHFSARKRGNICVSHDLLSASLLCMHIVHNYMSHIDPNVESLLCAEGVHPVILLLCKIASWLLNYHCFSVLLLLLIFILLISFWR
jgi:hypothetical protein